MMDKYLEHAGNILPYVGAGLVILGMASSIISRSNQEIRDRKNSEQEHLDYTLGRDSRSREDR